MASLFRSPGERQTAAAISGLAYSNPFLPERMDLERSILGASFTPFFAVWHPRADVEGNNPNVLRIATLAAEFVETLRERLADGAEADATDRRLYVETCLYALYYRHHQALFDLTSRPEDFSGGRQAPFWDEFSREFRRLLSARTIQAPTYLSPAHVLACFFQICRAFHFTFHSIGGSSLPVARLRAQIWQSIFTHDLRRYQKLLFDRMGEITTLITGPSGAGKELVARAVSLSRYIPFDPRSKSFAEGFEESFFPLHLAALSPTLIESELFGHRRGSFTGAIADRKGWLELCPRLGTVFLDEIGDLDGAIQVKLLRVLETRRFQPLGTSEERTFHGKVLAATHRDLAEEMHERRFREDLYFRLCADTVVAPSLQERLEDSPDELSTLLLFLAGRLVGEEEAPRLAGEAESWIQENLGPDYPWPGNVRELSQCLSNVLIRRDYRPALSRRSKDRQENLAEELRSGNLTADALLDRYCALVYAQTGSYVDAARRLGLDRRTVKARVDRDRLENPQA